MNSSDLHRKLSTEPVLSSGIRSKGKTSDRPTLPFFTHSAMNTWKAAEDKDQSTRRNRGSSLSTQIACSSSSFTRFALSSTP